MGVKKEKRRFWKQFGSLSLVVLLLMGFIGRPIKAENEQEVGNDTTETVYEVVTQVEGQGEILLEKSSYPAGAKVSFAINSKVGFVVESIQAWKESETREEIILVKEQQEERYQFFMPDCSVRIFVSFAEEKMSEKMTEELPELKEQRIKGNLMEEKELKEKEKKKSNRALIRDLGVKQILDYPLDGKGNSYLGYKSPITGDKMRVSLHRTADDEVAYCLDRTKISDKDDYNWGYEVISNKNTKYTDLQRNILLCGYPGNSVTELNRMYGISVNGRSAEQATQLAIWIGNYMIGEGVSLETAWSDHQPFNMEEYKAAALSKAILTRANDMLKQSLSVKGEVKEIQGEQVVCCFSLTSNGQYYPVEGMIANLPEGTKLTSEGEIEVHQDGKFTMNLVKGTAKIYLTFSKYAKAADLTLKAEGTIPIPPSYGGILFYENIETEYQDVVWVKEVKPFYSEKKAVIPWKPEPGGWLHLKKTAEDKKIEGITFNLSGPNQYSKDFTTNAKGEIDFGRLTPGIYRVTEKTPSRYVTAKVQTIELKDGEEKTVLFHNILRKMIITIEKKDSQGGIARGDGKLNGAEYTVYDSQGKAVDQLIIGMDHRASSKKLPVGLYTIKETKPSEGYTLDPSVYQADGTKKDPALELSTFHFVSSEKVIEGKIKIMKILENPDSQSDVLIPAKGIRFSYYLNSNPSERMTFTLDENGMGESKWMPYGTYTLEEENVPTGWKAVLPKTVRIEKDGETVSFYLIDKLDHKECKIIKKDKETGKQIRFAGTRFQIRRKDTNEIISQNIVYPVKKKISEFTTNEEGMLMLPEKLQAGDYLLYELEAPEGYVKEENPVEFTIPSGDTGTVEVVMENRPQKAELIIEKSGPVFLKAEKKEEQGQEILFPVFEERPLEGVVYELTAMEDVTTLDGTCRIPKGKKIEAVTDQEGKAVFPELYPGFYELKEKKTLPGYILDGAAKEVRITYGDPVVSIKKERLNFTNRCQVPKLNMTKKMEENPYLEMKEPWKEVVFGLYAGEDLKEQKPNGEKGEVIIPKDSLMDFYVIGESGEGISKYKTLLPYGQYYMKEIKTHPCYVLDSSVYEFSFELEEGDFKEEKEILVEKDEILNQVIDGKLELTKQELGTGKVIPGCKVEIKNEKGKVIVQGTTDEKGKIVFERIPKGNYTYREYEAPDGYILDEKEYPFEILEDGEIVKAVMENESIKEEEPTTEATTEATTEVTTTETTIEVPTTEIPVTEVPEAKESDEKKIDEKKPVQTGDGFPFRTYAVLLSVSLAGIIGIGIWKYKK